jgi:hypothetical protein
MAEPVELNTIAAQQRKATRAEMNELFRQYVCETTCPRVIKLLSDDEVRRLLALHLFDWNVSQHRKPRTLIMQHISIVLGVSRATMYRWFPPKEYEPDIP